ncbi:MAG: PaaI family thioesterase [Chitinophagia bacterium]|nr:PaaI family thioesterase [Chitinophagia bacterium]
MSYRDIPSGQVLAWLKQNYEGKKVTDSRSDAGNWLEFTLEAISEGSTTLSLIVKKDMTNPYNNLHGGMMAAIIDEAIGWAVVSLDREQHYTSLSLNVDFLFAIKVGNRLMAKANVLRAGKKIVNVECQVYDEANNLLARGNSNLIATNMDFKKEG